MDEFFDGFFRLFNQFLLVFYLLGYFIMLSVPVARIFKRVGISPWLSVLAVVPFVNLFGLWLFAFSPWPSDSAEQQEPEWSEADKEKFRQLMREQ
jgi:hypothetical protein